jgi:hypothetical protein
MSFFGLCRDEHNDEIDKTDKTRESDKEPV